MSRHIPWIFPYSNILVFWVELSLTPFLERTPILRLVNFILFIFVPHFLLPILPYSILRSTPKRTRVIPSLPFVMSGAEISTSTRSVHVHKIQNLQFPFVVFDLVIVRLLPALFIHSFIQFPICRSITLHRQSKHLWMYPRDTHR